MLGLFSNNNIQPFCLNAKCDFKVFLVTVKNFISTTHRTILTFFFHPGEFFFSPPSAGDRRPIRLPENVRLHEELK